MEDLGKKPESSFEQVTWELDELPQLDDMTYEPGSVLERISDFVDAEAIQAFFTALMDNFLGGLREQMSQDEDLYDDRQAQRSSLTRAFATMLPWQRFVLALLLFFNVAVLGCMLLAMAGRIVPSF